MSFPFNVYALALLGACAVTALSVPVWRRWCRHTGFVDDPGQRKIHDRSIPLAGGFAVLTGLLGPVLIGALATRMYYGAPGLLNDAATLDLLGYGFARRSIQLGALFAGAIGMVVLGALDDRHELRPLTKFVGQFLIAALVAASGIRITLFVGNAIFSYAITILWILTVTNACNFLDNMNGLCSGLGMIGAWSFAWAAAVEGQFLVASVALLTCGALLGFLPYNFPKASVFLGDAGSHLTGYLLAILAILPHYFSRTNPDTLAVVKPLIILGVFLGDLVWVVILRWRLGRPVYLGDTNHVSHRLVRCGLSQTRAVLVVWLLAALLGWISFQF